MRELAKQDVRVTAHADRGVVSEGVLVDLTTEAVGVRSSVANFVLLEQQRISSGGNDESGGEHARRNRR